MSRMKLSLGRSKLIAICTIFSIFTSGCLMLNQRSSTPVEVFPSNTMSPTSTQGITTNKTTTESSRVAATKDHTAPDQIELFDSKSIPAGTYLLYEDWDGNHSVFGINLETSEEYFLLDSWRSYSNKRNRVAYLNDNNNLVILDLDTQDENEVTLDLRCYEKNWSPGDSFLAINCEDQIYVVSTDHYEYELLTHWVHPSVDSYQNPIWSPDGEWIAASYRQLSSLNPTEDDGIYLLDTTCINKVSKCEDSMLGPFFSYVTHSIFAWGPNSQRIAAYVNYSLQVVNINTEEYITLIDDIFDVYGLQWSLDGNWIYYSRKSDTGRDVDIYKVSLLGGESVLIAQDSGVIISIIVLDD